MKRIIFILLLLVPVIAEGQVITTVAGGGISVSSGIPATAASIYNPTCLAFDPFGNLYFTENAGHKVRKIDTFGIITTVTGNGSPGFSGDGGPATAARVNQPTGITTDSFGNVIFVDGVNHRIRKIERATGNITTVIGNGTPGFSGDGGMASAASLYLPDGLWFDNSNDLFICDAGNNRLRKVNNSGIISTIAGNGLAGWGGDGGMATATRCYPWGGIDKDLTGNLYFTEWTWSVIRKINSTGIITTFAGDTSSYTYNGEGLLATNAHIDPYGIAFDASGMIYIADSYNNRVRKIDLAGNMYTIAGNGSAGSSGDGGPATAATVHNPSGIAFDRCGNLFFCQANTPRIRKITFNPTCDLESLNTNVFSNNENISIYPNPANDELHIDNAKPGTKYDVVSIVGALVHSGILQAKESSISIRNLPPGIYILALTNEQGIRTIHKIIKE